MMFSANQGMLMSPPPHTPKLSKQGSWFTESGSDYASDTPSTTANTPPHMPNEFVVTELNHDAVLASDPIKFLETAFLSPRSCDDNEKNGEFKDEVVDCVTAQRKRNCTPPPRRKAKQLTTPPGAPKRTAPRMDLALEQNDLVRVVEILAQDPMVAINPLPRCRFEDPLGRAYRLDCDQKIIDVLEAARAEALAFQERVLERFAWEKWC
jgi:hypothetical protein